MSRSYRNPRLTRSRGKKSNRAGGSRWMMIGILIGLGLAISYLKYQPVLHQKLLKATAQAVSSTSITHTTHKTTTIPSQSPVTPSKAPAPEFDFYTVLPKMQVQPNNPVPNNQNVARPTMPEAAVAATPESALSPNGIENAQAAVVKNQSSSLPLSNSPAVPISSKTTAPIPSGSLPAQSIEQTESATRSKKTQEHTERYALQVASVKNYTDADRLKAQLTMVGYEVSIQKFTMNGQTWNRVYVGPYSSRNMALKQQGALKEQHVSSILVKLP